ncbi:MAG: hypothetical protein L0099_05710, partial [Acidobacteria bacterium]|nr:hypothetical protein [Acidobacteriota bacterium]
MRTAALVALQKRPVAQYEQTLLGGLQYPLPAVADHAAEALVALDLRQSVPKLIPLLDARDLSEPFAVEWGQKRLTMVRQLVRINHMRNCLLCHVPSFSSSDLVRRSVPNAKHLVPLPSSASERPGTYGGAPRPGPAFIRADVIYLKQDFSVLQPVPNHSKLWPPEQRYDYLVRFRVLSKEELHLLQDKLREFRPASAQRESLMFALRELTRENPGPAPQDWKQLYSPITGQRFE